MEAEIFVKVRTKYQQTEAGAAITKKTEFTAFLTGVQMFILTELP